MEVIAHRGMPRQAPENTLAGFALAIEAGVDGIELDVHATRDGAVVVHHDPHLWQSGATDRRLGPAIATLTLDELRLATSGASGASDVPTLDETLALVRGRATVHVEVKAPRIEDAVVACITRHQTPAAVHSFDHRVALRVRELAPHLPTGILTASYLLEPERALLAAAARDYWQWWEMIDAVLVRRIHDAGGRVVAWTVNAPHAVERLAALGVDAICTDIPDRLAPVARSASAA